MPTIYQIVVIALLSSFIVLTMSKTGIRYSLRDWCDMRCDDFLDKVVEMLECDFCFVFWVSAILSTVAFALTLDFGYFVVPFLSSPISRMLV